MNGYVETIESQATPLEIAKEREIELRQWCVAISVKMCDEESFIKVADELYKWVTQ